MIVTNFLWSRKLVQEILNEKKDKLREMGIEQENVIQLRGDVYARDAAQTMIVNHSSSVIIEWKGEYDIFTQQDLCELVAQWGDLDNKPLYDIVTFKGLRSVSPRSTVGEALREMLFNKEGKIDIVRHLLVEDRGKIVGVMSMKDIDLDFFLALEKYEELLAIQNQ